MFQVLPANPSPLRVMPFSSVAMTVIPYRVLPDGVQAAVSDRLCLAARRTCCPPDEKAGGSSDWRAAPRARPAVGCSAPVFGGIQSGAPKGRLSKRQRRDIIGLK